MRVRIVWRKATGLQAPRTPAPVLNQPLLPEPPSIQPAPLQLSVTKESDTSSAAPDGEEIDLIECPACLSHDVRRSRRVGSLDELRYLVFRQLPYRCRNCKRRFFVSMAFTIQPAD